jgi:FlaA1/EpsC-like NDP-sugar epimerase
MQIFNIESFVSKHITGREESFFTKDMWQYREALRERIGGKSALVIGGAGTIGSSFIKALLEYGPAKVVVVDID